MNKNKNAKRIGLGIMTFLSMGIVLHATKYFNFNPRCFFTQQHGGY